jgi:hypothetical protein
MTPGATAPSSSGFPGARLAAAFAVAPVAAGAMMFITYLGLWYGSFRVFEGTPADPVDSATSIALGVALVAVGVALFAAAPVVWIAQRRRLSPGLVVLLGAALGNAPFAAIVGAILAVQAAHGTLSADVARLWYGWYGTARAILLGAWIGASTAAVFWLIGICGTDPEHLRTLFRFAPRSGD